MMEVVSKAFQPMEQPYWATVLSNYMEQLYGATVRNSNAQPRSPVANSQGRTARRPTAAAVHVSNIQVAPPPRKRFDGNSILENELQANPQRRRLPIIPHRDISNSLILLRLHGICKLRLGDDPRVMVAGAVENVTLSSPAISPARKWCEIGRRASGAARLRILQFAHARKPFFAGGFWPVGRYPDRFHSRQSHWTMTLQLTRKKERPASIRAEM